MTIYSPGDRIVYYGHNPQWQGLLGEVIWPMGTDNCLIALSGVEGQIPVRNEDIAKAVWTGEREAEKELLNNGKEV